MERFNTLIILPAFNESSTLPKLVRELTWYGDCLVVNDGSVDGTEIVAKANGANVISHRENLGYDQALKTGFLYAIKSNYSHVVTIDSDGQLDPSLVPIFTDELNNGYTVVYASRNKKNRLIEHMFSLYSFLSFGISDPLCGLKAYKVSILRDFFNYEYKLGCGTKPLIYAIKKSYPIKEIRVKIKERKGRSRFGNTFSANFKIFCFLIEQIKSDLKEKFIVK